MTCEICDSQTATIWTQPRTQPPDEARLPILSCSDCGPQLGWVTLAPLTTTTTR